MMVGQTSIKVLCEVFRYWTRNSVPLEGWIELLLKCLRPRHWLHVSGLLYWECCRKSNIPSRGIREEQDREDNKLRKSSFEVSWNTMWFHWLDNVINVSYLYFCSYCTQKWGTIREIGETEMMLLSTEWILRCMTTVMTIWRTQKRL